VPAVIFWEDTKIKSILIIKEYTKPKEYLNSRDSAVGFKARVNCPGFYFGKKKSSKHKPAFWFGNFLKEFFVLAFQIYLFLSSAG